MRPAESDNSYLHVLGTLVILAGWATVLAGFYRRTIPDAGMGLIFVFVFVILTALRLSMKPTMERFPSRELQRQFQRAFILYAIAVLSVALISFIRP